LFDDGLHRACDANAVAAHDDELFLPGFIEVKSVQRLAVLRAEFENMPDFNRALDAQRLPANGAGFARADRAQVCPMANFDVAFDRDVAQMESVLVRAGHHSDGAAECFVGNDGELCHADAAQAARMRAESLEDFLRCGRAKISTAKSAGELRFIGLIITTHQGKDDFAVDQINESLDLPLRWNAIRRLRERFDSEDTGSGKSFG
jgi:hypothetical protein